MTRIGATTIRPGSRPTPRRAASGGFSVADERPMATSGVGAGVASAEAAPVLGLQEVESTSSARTSGAAESDGATLRRGEDLLDLLGGLQRDLLVGSGGNAASLARLAALVAAPAAGHPSGPVDDPAGDKALASIVRAITCRAAIELARRTTDAEG